MIKVLLRECELLLQGVDTAYAESSVDIFCRACHLRTRCPSVPPTAILASGARRGACADVKPHGTDDFAPSIESQQSCADTALLLPGLVERRCPVSRSVFV